MVAWEEKQNEIQSHYNSSSGGYKYNAQNDFETFHSDPQTVTLLGKSEDHKGC